MTDKEIIQALECCKMPVGSGSCNDCPFDYQREKQLTSTDESCTTLMFDYALDLINRQQAEIENYSNNTKTMSDSIYKTQKLIESQQAEIERLSDLLKRNKRHTDRIRLITAETAKKIKAEAIKEFAERLDEWLKDDVTLLTQQRYIMEGAIEKTYLEMVGEDNG